MEPDFDRFERVFERVYAGSDESFRSQLRQVLDLSCPEVVAAPDAEVGEYLAWLETR